MEQFKQNLINASAPNAETMARQLMAQFSEMPDVVEMVAAVQQNS